MIYRHYKGGLYRLIGLGTHTETGEALVIYQGVEDSRLWARPEETFNGEAEVEGKSVPRFTPEG